jgi:hypothetical protein
MSNNHTITVEIDGVNALAVINKHGGAEGARRFLRDELVLVDPAEVSPRPPLDFTVCVDRSFVVLPSWADPSWLTHEFLSMQSSGPSEYDLQSGVEEWLHDDQETGLVTGTVFYKYLVAHDALADQLGLADLLAIQKMGIDIFRKLYAGKEVFAWKNVVRDRDNLGLDAPCLCEDGNEVVLGWRWLDDDWDSRDPALRFRK